MSLLSVWQALESSPLAQYIAASTWAFPTLESTHVLAIVTVLGTVALMDLRLLGVVSTESRITEVSKDTLRWTWIAFAVAVVTGGLLFISKAPTYSNNPFFLTKMGLILLAGLNMAIFHRFSWHDVSKWDTGVGAPAAAKFAGGISLGFWLVVILMGRIIGFTLDKYAPV